VVVDGSGSMRLPAALSSEESQRIEQGMASTDRAVSSQASRGFEELANSPGPKRIDLVREGLAGALMASGERVPAVTFQGCGSLNVYPPDRAVAAIRSLRPNGGTPIAESLQRAARLLPQDGRGRHGNIVLVTDGTESCRGDPCGVAQQLKADNPDLVINVVDIVGATPIQCVVDATGGTVYQRTNDVDLARILAPAMDSARSSDCTPSTTAPTP